MRIKVRESYNRHKENTKMCKIEVRYGNIRSIPEGNEDEEAGCVMIGYAALNVLNGEVVEGAGSSTSSNVLESFRALQRISSASGNLSHFIVLDDSDYFDDLDEEDTGAFVLPQKNDTHDSSEIMWGCSYSGKCSFPSLSSNDNA